MGRYEWRTGVVLGVSDQGSGKAIEIRNAGVWDLVGGWRKLCWLDQWKLNGQSMDQVSRAEWIGIALAACSKMSKSDRWIS